ncbi:MAG: deoxyribonuclease IV [Candidatus Nitrosocaldus sp.]|nr:deoxyribonuclease IV [Candidatus Nitrosocaldus sp.]
MAPHPSHVRIGVHVSISGSIDRAVDNALSIGCSAFQIFTRNPRGWAAKPLQEQDAKRFRTKLDSSGIGRDAVFAHMPYLPNLASPKQEIYSRSLAVLVEEIRRCSMLGIGMLVIHLGSHMGSSKEQGMQSIVNACNEALKERDDVTILLENMAGQRNSIGASIDELGRLFRMLDGRRVGVCIDTCHLFAAGYELRSRDSLDKLVYELDRHIGLKNIRLLHLNDSKHALGSSADRHEHIGLGYIGEEGFRNILAMEEFRSIPWILETPVDSRRDDAGNIRKVRELAMLI